MRTFGVIWERTGADSGCFADSGLLRRKNALSMLFLALAVYSVCAVEWMFWGYSLTFSSTGSSFIGDLKHFGLINVLDAPSPGSSKIPELLFCFFQGSAFLVNHSMRHPQTELI